jgi:hypothetical protein
MNEKHPNVLAPSEFESRAQFVWRGAYDIAVLRRLHMFYESSQVLEGSLCALPGRPGFDVIDDCFLFLKKVEDFLLFFGSGSNVKSDHIFVRALQVDFFIHFSSLSRVFLESARHMRALFRSFPKGILTKKKGGLSERVSRELSHVSF